MCDEGLHVLRFEEVLTQRMVVLTISPRLAFESIPYRHLIQR
jgi:hypothetical protein